MSERGERVVCCGTPAPILDTDFYCQRPMGHDGLHALTEKHGAPGEIIAMLWGHPSRSSLDTLLRVAEAGSKP